MWRVKSVEGVKVSFRVMVSMLFNRPSPDRCEMIADSGAEMAVTFASEDKHMHISVLVNRKSQCALTVRQRSTKSQEKLQAWREIDRRDVFKDFERRHANKFAFLDEGLKNKPRDWLNIRPTEPLSLEEQDHWKKKYITMKTKHERKLRLFQKLSNYKQEEIDEIEDLDSKPFLMEILVNGCY